MIIEFPKLNLIEVHLWFWMGSKIWGGEEGIQTL